MPEQTGSDIDFDVIKTLAGPADTRILLVVMDGLGGLPMQPGGQTELEAAHTPHLDELAAEGICGLHTIGPGITPGSGPGHLGLFGYDPFRYQVGRGVLSALGLDFDLQPRDVAARGNFCTIDEHGLVQDRRAGRISTEKNHALCELLRQIELPDVEIFLEPEKDYRFLLVLRGQGLSGNVTDTDPQVVGENPLQAQSLDEQSRKTARLVNTLAGRAHEILQNQHPANMILLRGFSTRPDWPVMQDIYRLNPAVIASYPMYRGVAKLAGMRVLPTGPTLDDEVNTLEEHWHSHDFFFLHFKPVDSAGEDGDFDRKSKLIEELDHAIPRLLKLKPDVVVVTGDHSTPAKMKMHGWQPVPALIWSQYCRPDGVKQFGERACMLGGLGPSFPVTHLMPIALANAGRLNKFGA
jgi:2,3-bisphosphoglycerate-independent phosphoglycerate mutase